MSWTREEKYFASLLIWRQNHWKDKELEILIQGMRIYSDDIAMEFGIEKYVVLIMKSRKWQMTKGIELPNQEKIWTPRVKEIYKYLGVLAVDSIKQVEMREKLKKNISEDRKSYSKPNYIVEISSKR